MGTPVRKASRFSEDEQQALAYLARNPTAFDTIVGMLTAERDRLAQAYEQAKEILVQSGDNRPVCLTIKGRLEQTNGIIEMFNSIKEL